MGGQAELPREQSQIQAYNPNPLDWANFGLKQQMQGLQMQYYTPLLKDTMEKRKLYKGVMNNDLESLRKFSGMPKEATREQILDRINTYRGRGNPQAMQPNPQTPAKTQAAKGGIMQVKRYADGGTTKPSLTADQIAFIQRMATLMESGQTPTQAQQDRLNKIETTTGRNVSPYTDTGTITPGNAAAAKAATAMQTAFGKTGDTPKDTTTPAPFNPYEATQPPTYGMIGGTNPSDPIEFTNPWVNNALNYYNNMQAPSELGQAGNMFNTAAQGLQGLANYSPQQVAAQQAVAQQGAAERAAAAQMAGISDVNAERVNLGQYNVNASQMMQPKEVQAQALQRYQMGQVAPVTTKDLEAYQMAGPGSWTDAGVSSKYMSPYMQGVVDISKREAERDYQKQVNALNAKAISAGAFGGSRQALERSEGQRNYNQQLQDLETRGMQQAYESGRAQYGQELGLSQQAALQNLQSKLSTQSQSSQQQLQAMLSNQSIDYQTKVQNLQAMLGVQSQEATQMLNAALANQQTAFGTGQTNAQLAQQAALANQGVNSQGALANQQAALQAALANQQTQFGVGSLNANLMNQTNLQNASLGTQASLTNAQLGTQASLANAQNALQASMANQQAGLQGNAQNIGAYSAMGSMAQGLGSLGNSQANWQQQQFGNAANIAQWTNQMGQNYWNNQYLGQQGVYGGSQMPGQAPGGAT